MTSLAAGNGYRVFLTTALATRGERKLALVVAIVALAAFAACVPFVRTPLAPMPAFIPSYEAALFFIDLITAIVLFDQFARLRSSAMLVLASGYLFDALIVISHALSFPGAFTAPGLLGAREQTTAWLYVFWHGGFPLFVIGYALLRRNEHARAPQQARSVPLAVAAAIIAVAVLAAALALLATGGHDWLPIVMQGSDYSLLVTKGISPAVWALTLAALLSLWPHRERALDLWLIVVMWVWLFDIALAAVIGSSRFDLGFYAGRVFGLIGASFLLVMVTVQMAKVHTAALRMVASTEEKFAQLARARARAAAQPGSGGTGSFVQRRNIAHYLDLLSRTTDEKERATLMALLREEEEKQRTGDRPAGQ